MAGILCRANLFTRKHREIRKNRGQALSFKDSMLPIPAVVCFQFSYELINILPINGASLMI